MTRLAVLLVGVLALTACRQTQNAQNASAAAQGNPGGGGPSAADPLSPPTARTGGVPANGTDRMRRAWNLLGQWDAAQSSGQKVIAARLRGELQQVVDGGFSEFVQAARGTRGVEMQYLATSVLGFSQNPGATQVIEQRLDSKDPNLIANALVALALRRDPSTRLSPVLMYADERAPELPRRYAPLVVATTLDARARAGQPRDPQLDNEVFRRVAPLASDEDVYTRLHAARALGSVRSKGSTDYLLGLARDREMRVRWAAAAALERGGDPRGFPEVVRLLHEVPPESKHIIQDILVTYAGRIRGSPLTNAEVTELGVSSAQWSRWFANLQRERGFRVPPSRSQ